MSAMPAAPDGILTDLRTENQSFVPFHPPMTGPPATFLQLESMKSDITRASNQFCEPRTTSVIFASSEITAPSLPFGKNTGV